MRSIFTGAKKCGGKKPHKGRSPTAVFRSLAAEGGVQLQSCYMPFFLILSLLSLLIFPIKPIPFSQKLFIDSK
jgi:hypothetical protein